MKWLAWSNSMEDSDHIFIFGLDYSFIRMAGCQNYITDAST